ncbi:hypothetical protein I4U23_014727 [Adineta vaga]|nr:hypothetical protein I4U23_014727 [Adineta vaga]
MNLGTCFFTFTNTTTMNIACTNDTSNTLSQIPATLLGGTYMSNITHVTFSSNISILPTYLCSLPSREIDISYQTFTTLSDTTFPCLDSFRKVSLSRNQISSVNIVNGNFQNLTSLDLSANQLTSIPYSVLMPTPTSLRSLDLRNNSINYIDLFVYTRKNINIYLDNNPINSTNILNPQNTTLIFTTNSTANVTFPASVTSSTIIIDDSIAITYGVCNDFQSLRNMLLSLESTDAEVQLDCSCKSVNLKQIYLNNNQNILVDFSCSNPSQAETFFSVSMATCPTYANFSSGLCTNEGTGNVQSSNNSDSNRTGLIVGLVVGIGGFLLLLAAIIAAIILLKRCKGGGGAGDKRRVSRISAKGSAAPDGQKAPVTPSTRLQSRNPRGIQLAASPSTSSQLPSRPVEIMVPNIHNDPNLRKSTRGIPLRLDPIRPTSGANPLSPPVTTTLSNPTTLRSTNSLPMNPPSLSQPPPHQVLNIGGDVRF